MNEMVLAFILPHRQLELTNCLLYLNLQNNIYSLWLGKPVIQLKHLITTQVAQLITSIDRFGQVIHIVEHNLSSHQITNPASSLYLLFLPFCQNQSDLPRPNLHYFVHDVQ
jgi:hypothetical protein